MNDLENFKEKNQRNARVQARYNALMQEGKHGHYETMFKVVREEVEAERERCAQVAEHLNGWDSPPTPELAAHIAKVIRRANA